MDNFFIPPPPGTERREDPKGIVQAVVKASTPQAIVEEIAINRSYRRVEGVAVHECRCQRCPKVWYTLLLHKPKTCPGCHNPWWDTPKKERANGPKTDLEGAIKKKKKGVRVAKVKGKVGRPRKDASKGLEAGGDAPGNEVIEAPLPDIPVEILGALGGSTIAPVETGGRESKEVEEAFPVPTPFNGGIPVQPVSIPSPYQTVETGQPVDDGRSTPLADEAEPLPPLESLSDEEYWRN